MKVQSDIQTLLTLIEDGATGVRGYVLTGRNDFLIPYRNARQQLPTTLDALRANVRDPEQVSRSQRVIPLIELKLSSLDELSELRGTTSEDLREHLLASKEVLDQLRGEIRAMNEREAALVEARTVEVKEAIRRNALMNAATALVGLAGSAAILIFTIRMVRRVRRATDNAERLASELPLLPGDPATDELGQLSDRLERASAVLATRAAAAQAANRAKTDFLSRTSHELRTPLNAILGFAQLLERDLGDPQQQQQASHIVRAGRHLLTLIDDVLDIARIESGGLPVESESIDVDGLLSEAIALVTPLADKRQIRVQGPSVDESLAILADRQRASQVVLNLLSNAIKYNQHGGWVRIDVSSDEQGVVIDVVDGGPGIPVDLKPRLFTPFDRLGAERHNRDGIGLGLALSKSLMQQMSGQIDVDSQPGSGSTFKLTFPRAAISSSTQMDAAASSSDMVPNVTPDERTVLCVEDDDSNLVLVETLLMRRPHLKLITARDGNEALKLVHDSPPDLILLDLNLPGQSGEAILRVIRTSPGLSAIPVVILSADALQDSIERLRTAGATAYLTKPLDLKAFYTILDETLT
ncbi:ATP-binding protein [Burkholderia sp. Ac-20345]|uniref:ATP-binding protein n=1 Tax=Burkholderia sp. Ac-20345 TaxID=2703891 RepID=UPI001F120B7F|nr:ATP-binding protein [Burkholderia sp. Ac-20345]